MNRLCKIAAVTVIALSVGTGSAWADYCTGHSHETGTILGAAGGGLIGGLASHTILGAVVGGVAGGLVGNAIARSNDCHRYSYRDRYGRRHYYYATRAYDHH